MAVLTRDTEALRSVEGGGLDRDPYIRVGEILSIRRCHPPVSSAPISRRSQPEGLDDCLIARNSNVQAFHLEGCHEWVDYNAISDWYTHEDRHERKGHTRPYAYDDVFSPLRVLLAECDTPIRASLAFESVYPWQLKVGVPNPGQSLWLVYAAVAVLNTEVGLAYYRRYLAELVHGNRLRSRARHGLNGEALKLVQVAPRNFRRDDLAEVAFITHQLTALWDTLPEFKLQLGAQSAPPGTGEKLRALDGVVRTYTDLLMPRLETAVCRLLQMSEDEERTLVSELRPTDAQPSLAPSETLSLGSEIGRLSLLDQMSMRKWRLSSEEHELLCHWDRVVNERPLDGAVATEPSGVAGEDRT